MWEIINKLLKQKNKTVYWLAKESNITRQALYALQKGKTKTTELQTAFRIADALEVDVNIFRKE